MQIAAAVDGGFYSPSKVPVKPKNYNAVVAASEKLNSDTGKCSGSFISRHGHFLTAAHCLSIFAGYPKELGVVVTKSKDSVTYYPGDTHGGAVYTFTHYSKRTPNYDSYTPMFPEDRDTVGYRVIGKEKKYGAAKVLLVGRDEFSFHDDFVGTKSFPSELFEEKLGTDFDYAIIKFPKAKNVACVPLSNRDAKPGESVWMVGHPAKNSRPNGLGSDGQHEFTSYGKVVKDIFQNDYFLENNYSSERLDLLNRYYAAPHKIVSNMDGFPGNSGSSIVDSNGKVVGVMNSGAMPHFYWNKDRYIKDSAVGVRSSVIVNDIKTYLSAAEAKQIFDCPTSTRTGGLEEQEESQEQEEEEQTPPVELDETSKLSCRYTSNADQRCCSVGLEPTWWCKEGTLEKTASSCTVSGKAAVVWSCQSSSTGNTGENSSTGGGVVVNTPRNGSSKLDSVSEKALVSALCSNAPQAVCPNGGGLLEKDARFANYVKLKNQVKAKALARVGKSKSNGGCVASGVAGPTGTNEKSIQEWILDDATTNTNARRIERGICYAQILEDEVFKVLKGTFTKSQLETIFSSSRKAMLELVNDQSNQSSLVNGVKDEMITELNRVQLITPSRYEEWGSLGVQPGDKVLKDHHYAYLSNPDGGACGKDLMRVNLVASSTGYYKKGSPQGVHTGMLAVVICPMSLLWVAQNESSTVDSTWYHWFGHEIGHHIHAVRNRPAENHVDVNGNVLTTNFAPAYEHFSDCMHKHYDTEMHPEQDLEADNSRTLELEKILGRKPKGLDFQLAEISADFWGNLLIEKVIVDGKLSPQKAARSIYESMKRLCITQDSMSKQYITSPALSSRIAFTLDRPMTRLALGCKDINPVTTCGFEGEEN